MKKKGYKIGFVVCMIAFIVICSLMAYQYIKRRNAENKIEKMRESIQESASQLESEIEEVVPVSTISEPTQIPIDEHTPTPTSEQTPTPMPPSSTEAVDILTARGITIPEKNIDWDELRKVNADIYAWIYIPGTNVDYPIVRHPDEKSYYLTHNYDHSEGYPGCIYVQNVNSNDWSDPNTVIYGHNMRNGSMFHTLHNFEDAIFFDEHQFTYIYTPEGNKVYEIFASYPFNDDDLIVNYDYSTPELIQTYFDEIWIHRDMTAHYRESVSLHAENKIITMSTCISGQPDKRYLVQAVLLN